MLLFHACISMRTVHSPTESTEQPMSRPINHLNTDTHTYGYVQRRNYDIDVDSTTTKLKARSPETQPTFTYQLQRKCFLLNLIVGATTRKKGNWCDCMKVAWLCHFPLSFVRSLAHFALAFDDW